MARENMPRLAGVDALRGLCMLAVVTAHALMLFAPRIVHLRCDLLGPAHIPCGTANAYGFLVANVFAVCVFAFLSGLVMPAQLPAGAGLKRGLRMHLAALTGVIATAALLVYGAVESERLARLFAPLPYTKPVEASLLLQPDGWRILTFAFGLDYSAIAMDGARHLQALWPPIWCVPWFLAGWFVLLGIGRLPGRRAWYLLAVAMAALPLSDQGIVTAMVAGQFLRPYLVRLPGRWALALLIAGLLLASLPLARGVSSDWVRLSMPVWLTSAVQAGAAGLVATGFLSRYRLTADAGIRWFGRHSLAIYALHWPLLLLAGSWLLNWGVPGFWLALAAIALTPLPFMLGAIMMCRAAGDREPLIRSGAR